MTRAQQIVLVRHGATEWSVSGKHTGRTDLPLSDEGRRSAEGLRAPLGAWTFARVFTSPLRRAQETCRLAGFGDVAEARDDLQEWDYGAYEGRTLTEIHIERPDWLLWRDGAPGGESPADVGARADRVLAEVRTVDGDVLMFAHGHVLRVLTARWLGLPAGDGRLFALDTARLSVLGYEGGSFVMLRWNAPV
jgi:broad specificity phosphatase PhoE